MIEFLKTPAGVATFAVVATAVIIFIIDVNYRFFMKSVLDFVLAVIFTAILSPVLAVCAIISKVKAGAVFNKIPCLGAGGKIIFVREYAAFNGGFKKLAHIFDVLCGKMSFVGVKLMPVADGAFMDDEAMRRFTARPAIFNHLAVTGNAELTYEETFAKDIRYAKKRELFYDIYIVLKSAVLALRGDLGRQYGETSNKTYAEVLFERGEATEEDLQKAQAYAAEALEEFEKRRNFKKSRYK